MDFDQMQAKLDNHEYKCAQDFLDDIDLVAENAIKYNGDPNYETNKIICHRARALQDFAYALVKAEMDTDFEEDCKEIVRRRKSLTTELKKTEKESDKKFFSMAGHQNEKNESCMSAANSHRKRKPRRKISKWQRGYTPKAKKTKDKLDKDDQTEPNSAEKDIDEVVNDGNPDGQDENGNSDENSDAMYDIENEDTRLSASAIDISAQTPNAKSPVFQLDEEKLVALEKELLKQTDNLAVEHIERLYCHLIECVRTYQYRHNRSNLVEVMRCGLPSTEKANSKKM